MKLSEWIKMKELGYEIDKDKTPINNSKWNRESAKGFIGGDPFRRKICFYCEHSERRKNYHYCNKKKIKHETLFDLPGRCEEHEIDDYFFDLEKLVVKE